MVAAVKGLTVAVLKKIKHIVVELCYNCHRFGHVGKDCPVKRTHVNQIGGKRKLGEQRKRISKVITRARSLGLRFDEKAIEETPLIGKTMTVWEN